MNKRGTTQKSGFTLIELLVVIAIIAILAAILFPVFARARAAALASGCQSNLKQIGTAVNMYTQDYEETYPTNRSSLTATGPNARVFLPPYSSAQMISYVAGLEKYIQKSGNSADAASVWKCGAVSNSLFAPPNTPGNPAIPGFGESRISYVINFWILEETEGTAKFPAQTMLFRENGCLGQSYAAAYVGAPTGPYTGAIPPTTQPSEVFLTSNTNSLKNAQAKKNLHGDGSHILFLDGHVEKLQNSIMQEANIRNTAPIRPGAWVLCEGGDVNKPKIWINP